MGGFLKKKKPAFCLREAGFYMTIYT